MRVVNTSAVVTGGSSGLGAATADALAAKGVRVFAIDLNPPERPTDGVTYLEVDVTNEAQVEQAIAAASAHGPLRSVINCAGIAPSMRILGRSGRHDIEAFARVLQINVVGTFTVMTLAAEQMAMTDADAEGHRGVIVNTASIAAYEGQIGQAAYAASKAAVVGITLPAARELASFGIRVCTIAPGIVETPMMHAFGSEIRHALAESVPFPQRFGSASEFARLALMLLDHDYMNGETVRMDGALRMAAR